MSIKIKRIVFAVLIIINCIAIFNLSAQDSEKSNKTSGVVVDRVVNTVSKVNKKVKKETLKDEITFYVRKLAHFSIYTMLGIFLMCEATTFKGKNKIKILICVIYGGLYAMSDEFHQSFVGGRSPEIRDVVIDTCGVIFGCALVIIAYKIICKIQLTNRDNHVKIVNCKPPKSGS